MYVLEKDLYKGNRFLCIQDTMYDFKNLIIEVNEIHIEYGTRSILLDHPKYPMPIAITYEGMKSRHYYNTLVLVPIDKLVLPEKMEFEALLTNDWEEVTSYVISNVHTCIKDF